MKSVKLFLGLLLSFGVVIAVEAQTKPLRFHGNPDYYLQVQNETVFKVADEGLDAYPPVVGAPIERRLALYNLDCLLHNTDNDNSPAFFDFINSRVTKLLADLEKPVKRGMRIYKIYNDAFIVRTKGATIAFDISRCRCRGHNDPIVSNELVEQLVQHCDILFLSHNHRDHVDSFVADLFIKAGKPIVATPNILVGKEGVIHRRVEGGTDHLSVKLKNGKELDVTIIAGFQGKVANNVYAVTTPEKYTVCHTGDLSGKANFKWIPYAKDNTPKIDALMVNCWVGGLSKVIAGFAPRYIITGHENEMGHTIDHREAYWHSFARFAEIDRDYVVMAWGEWFTIK